jgi:hypothetical protein
MAERKVLDRAAILDIKLKRQEVDIPGAGVIIVQELTGAQGAEFQRISLTIADGATRQIKDAGALARLSALAIMWGAIDEAGQPLFMESDLPAIMAMGTSFLDALASPILELSGLDLAAKARAQKKTG